MITIAMVHKPLDSNKHMWSINCEVFPIIHGANEQWPGIKAYRLTGQEKYYEPTWVPESDEGEQLGTIQFATDIELGLPEVQDTEVGTPQPQELVGSTPPLETTGRKPLTFIDLKVQQ